MKTIKFNKEVYKNCKTKKIYLVEKSISYLDELCNDFDILSNIAAIVDEDQRKCGDFFYRGTQITVYPLEYLMQIELEDAIILIISDYYYEYVSKIDDLFSGELKETYVFCNFETRLELEYRKHYRDKELQDIIVFRSGPHNREYVRGMDFADNARALFEYMISSDLNKRFELIWLVKNPDEYTEYTAYENVFFLAYEDSVSKEKKVRDEYYRALCLAKYLFFTDAYGFARNCRDDQIRIQLWHGCGYKMRLNHTPCGKRYEYMTVTSELYAKLHAKAFGLRNEQMLVTGCAKEDWLFQENRDKLKCLDFPKADQYVLWMPTYRFSGQNIEKPRDGDLNKETGLPLMSSGEDLVLLDKILISHHMVLLIKLHPFQESDAVHCTGLSNIILIKNEVLLENDIQVNQLLSIADALISDYSSAAVDYLMMDRPMGFIVDDIENYSSRRGFIFENILDWLPGKCIFKKRELIDFIEEIAYRQDSHRIKRQNLCGLLHKNVDGENCKRIVESLKIVER